MEQYMKHVLSVLLILGVIILLIGCSSAPKPGQLDSKIEAVNFLNPNIYNQPSPVVVVFYQLKSETAFQQANFFALYNDPIKALGNDLIDKKEIEIRPQQKQELRQVTSPETTYIGVIAAFRNPDNAQWRQVISVKPGKKVKLLVNLEAQSITTKID